MYVNGLHYSSLEPEIFNIQKHSVNVTALHTAYTAALVGWTDSTEGSDWWPHWTAGGPVSLPLLHIHFNSFKETHRLLMPCCRGGTKFFLQFLSKGRKARRLLELTQSRKDHKKCIYNLK